MWCGVVVHGSGAERRLRGLLHGSKNPDRQGTNDRKTEGEGRRRQAGRQGCWRPRNVAGCSTALRAKLNSLRDCHNEWHTLCYVLFSCYLSCFSNVCFNLRSYLLIKLIRKTGGSEGVRTFSFLSFFICRPKCLIYLLGMSQNSLFSLP